MRDLAPHVTVVDLTHGIRPFDVRGGSLALARAIPYVAEGVVLAVVDPGVGTARRAIAIEVAGGAGVLVGPDNGLLAPAVAIVGGAERAVELTNTEYHLAAPGATFAGRDVFAPVAAHLCNGVDLAELGPLIDADVLMPGMVAAAARARPTGSTPRCCGSTASATASSTSGPTTSTRAPTCGRSSIGDERRAAHVATSFGDLGPGSVGLVLDSQGMYALALDQRSAAAELRLAAGDAVVLVAPIDDGAERDRRRPPRSSCARPGSLAADAPGHHPRHRPAARRILVAGVIALLRSEYARCRHGGRMGARTRAGSPIAVNVAHIIDGHDAATPALISRNQTITYGELADRADRLRGGLAGLGIADGDRVALICGNGHPFVIAYLALVGLGAVAVPLNPTSPAPELQRQLAAVDAVGVVVDRSAAATWRNVDLAVARRRSAT